MKKEVAINFRRKWSNEVSELGFTQVPNLLITCQGHLGLKNGELIALLQLMKFWYDHDSRIFPAIDTLANYGGDSYPTAQRNLKNLEKKGFLKRQHRFGSSDNYDLNPCSEKLFEHVNLCPSVPQFLQDDWSDLSRLPY